MSTVAYNCPACGAPLTYGAEGGKLDCEACGNSFELEALEAMAPAESGGEVKFAAPESTFDAAESEQMQAYICKSCGAELLTENTTTATECPYCGSPTVLPDRIEGGVKPEKVVPFTVEKEAAQKQFDEYFKGKLLMPNIFLNTRNRISEMRRLFVPYWLFDCDARADIVYEAEKRRTERRGDWEIEHIRHYAVRRDAAMSFENIPVDSSEKLDNKITESIEPYDLSAAVPFQPAVQVGAMADPADVDAEACQERAVERVKTTISDAVRDTVVGYTNVYERSKNIQSEGGKVTPVLMPVWLITTEKENKTYTFAINGQTGRLTCDVPADKKKSALLLGGVFAGLFALIAVILALIDAMSGVALLCAGIASAVISFIVFSVFKGQLKQAARQNSAANYVKEGSFTMFRRYDRFLYETTNRRRIQTNNNKN